MTCANSHISDWPPPAAAESVDTLAIPLEEGEYAYVIHSPDATTSTSSVEEQNRMEGAVEEKLLDEVVDKIRSLTPLEVDGKTQRLLDAAIENQETGLCDDLERWASRLADDVKDAGD